MYFISHFAVQAHEDFKKNKQPVQQTHRDATSNFIDQGRKAYDQASPAVLALINTSPDLPPSTYRPFRWTCCASYSELVVLHWFQWFFDRFVADEKGDYRYTAALCCSYTNCVLGISGKASQVFRCVQQSEKLRVIHKVTGLSSWTKRRN